MLIGGGLGSGTHKFLNWHLLKNLLATCRHLNIFGTPWCENATRPDRYERHHCSVSLMILSFGFYPDYTRFALGKLQLRSYCATHWKRGRPPTYLNLQTPSYSSRTKILHCSGLNESMISSRHSFSTLYQSTSLESNHSPGASHHTPR